MTVPRAMIQKLKQFLVKRAGPVFAGEQLRDNDECGMMNDEYCRLPIADLLAQRYLREA